MDTRYIPRCLPETVSPLLYVELTGCKTICEKLYSSLLLIGSPFLIHRTEVAGPPVVTHAKENFGGFGEIKVN